MTDQHQCWFIAGFLALLGDSQTALDWLEMAVSFGFINYPLLSADDPSLESIRDEERFAVLMERVKREWEEFGRELEGEGHDE